MANIELKESELEKKYPGVLQILLTDRTTKKNIIWATNNYSRFGIGFMSNDYINLQYLINHRRQIIKPRILKSKTEQKKRAKNMAEVFTPAWICNIQNNLIDNEWFGYKNSFNKEKKDGWRTSKKVKFKNRNWKDYIDLERMEITCGEAPYLTSRYDVVTGKEILPLDRIGLLDRKLRVVCENTDDENEYIENSLLSLKRIYGYDFQGDNVLIARKNLFFTYIEFYEEKFKKEPPIELLKKVAKIISWNIWQMDGLKYVIPYSCQNEENLQLNLFEDMQGKLKICKGCQIGNIYQHNGNYSRIKDWRSNRIIKFIDTIK